jgi:hypothetical protein
MTPIEKIWIKAAIENRIVSIDYFDREKKEMIKEMEIEPYCIEIGKKDIKKGLLGSTKEGEKKIIYPDSIIEFKVKHEKFSPKEHPNKFRMNKIYNRSNLKYKKYPVFASNILNIECAE